jgi:hypothetical protein
MYLPSALAKTLNSLKMKPSLKNHITSNPQILIL